jgi:hypothetical protein
MQMIPPWLCPFPVPRPLAAGYHSQPPRQGGAVKEKENERKKEKEPKRKKER